MIKASNSNTKTLNKPFEYIPKAEPSRMALLKVSEAAYAMDLPAPKGLSTSRYLKPLVPKTSLQRRVLKKTFARKRVFADTLSSAALKSLSDQPFVSRRRIDESSIVPQVKLERKDIVCAREWDSKMQAPTLNMPLRVFTVTMRGEWVVKAISHIDEEVTFVLQSDKSLDCISTCGQYMLIQ